MNHTTISFGPVVAFFRSRRWHLALLRGGGKILSALVILSMILPGATGAGRASNQYPPERSSGVNSIQYPETQPAAALAGPVTATAAASGTPISEATVTGTPVSDATPAVTAAATIPPTLGTGTPSSTPPTSEATPTATPGSTGTPGVTDISNWAQLGGSFTTPSNAAYVKVELRTQMTSGWLTFDDITLQGGAERVYYNAGGTRVAMRLNGALKWLFGDHLGSTHKVANRDGTPDTPIQLCKPWGEKRYPAGASILPTTFRYTGQRAETGLGPSGGEGLYFYGARFYDPQLGRFTPPPLPSSRNLPSQCPS